MKKKLIFFMYVLCLFTADKSFSQKRGNYSKNIIDYFFPAEYNKSTFVMGSNGKSTKLTLTISYYSSSDDVTYRTKEETFLEDKVYSTHEKTFKITSSQVSIINESSWSPLMGSSYNNDVHPKIILKMPKTGRSENWKYKDGAYNYECTSQLITVNLDENKQNSIIDVNGNKQRAIKVSKKAFSGGKFIKWESVTEYYVLGIGYWKTQGNNGSDFWVLKEQSLDVLGN